MNNKKPNNPSSAKKSSSSALLEKPAEKKEISQQRTSSSNRHTTQVVIKYDVGFGNTLTIRGQGAGLSWDKGIQLKNVKPNEWVWETNATFAIAEFKVLINDRIYETGPNHPIKCDAKIQYTPRF